MKRYAILLTASIVGLTLTAAPAAANPDLLAKKSRAVQEKALKDSIARKAAVASVAISKANERAATLAEAQRFLSETKSHPDSTQYKGLQASANDAQAKFQRARLEAAAARQAYGERQNMTLEAYVQARDFNEIQRWNASVASANAQKAAAAKRAAAASASATAQTSSSSSSASAQTSSSSSSATPQRSGQNQFGSAAAQQTSSSSSTPAAQAVAVQQRRPANLQPRGVPTGGQQPQQQASASSSSSTQTTSGQGAPIYNDPAAVRATAGAALYTQPPSGGPNRGGAAPNSGGGAQNSGTTGVPVQIYAAAPPLQQIYAVAPELIIAQKRNMLKAAAAAAAAAPGPLDHYDQPNSTLKK